MKIIKITYEDTERDIIMRRTFATTLIYEDLKDFGKNLAHKIWLLLTKEEINKSKEHHLLEKML